MPLLPRGSPTEGPKVAAVVVLIVHSSHDDSVIVLGLRPQLKLDWQGDPRTAGMHGHCKPSELIGSASVAKTAFGIKVKLKLVLGTGGGGAEGAMRVVICWMHIIATQALR